MSLRPDRLPVQRTCAPHGLLRSALRWANHCRDCGCRFDADRKAADAIAFAIRIGAASFVLPSKLESVAPQPRQHQLALLRQRLREAPCWHRLRFVEADSLARHRSDRKCPASPCIVVLHEGDVLGHIRKKHHQWLAPLLPFGRVAAYVLAVTGGPPYGAGHYGCNIVLAGLSDALSDFAEAAGEDAASLPMQQAQPIATPSNGLADGSGQWDIEALPPIAIEGPNDRSLTLISGEPCTDGLAFG